MLINKELHAIVEAIKSAVTVEQIYLFGSHANNTSSKDSDYDIFILLPENGIKPYDAIRDARFSLISLNRETSVDIIADYKNRFLKRSKLNTLERIVANEGIILYERV